MTIVSGREGLDLFQDGDPVHLGHPNIEKNEVEDVLFEKLEDLFAIGGQGNLVVLLFEHDFEEFPHALFVIDHQDLILQHSVFSSCLGRQKDGKRGPFAHLALDLDDPVVVFNDLVNDRETQACSSGPWSCKRARRSSPSHEERFLFPESEIEIVTHSFGFPD